jgi:hypothetical protein
MGPTGEAEARTELAEGAVTLTEKVRWNFDGIGKGEEFVPGFGFAGEDDIAGFGILADEDFAARETQRRRQADSLAAAVFERFGGFLHVASRADQAA